MGAAGLNLFDSDHDFDSISDLTYEAGLDELAIALRAKAKTKAAGESKTKSSAESKAKDAKTRPEEVSDEDYAYRFSLRPSGQLTNEESQAVRKHLESGVMDCMINERLVKVRSGQGSHYPYPGYELVPIAVCAMMYGCRLDDLRRNIRSVGVTRDAVKQVDIALNDPVKGYKNDGTEYHLEFFKGDESDKISLGSMLINTPAPFGMIRARGTQAVQPNTRVFAKGLCGGCGTHKKEGGGKLTRYGKCHSMTYCGQKCQRADWKRHKAVCSA